MAPFCCGRRVHQSRSHVVPSAEPDLEDVDVEGFTPLPVVNKRAPVPLATRSPPGSSSSPTRRFPRLWKLIIAILMLHCTLQLRFLLPAPKTALARLLMWPMRAIYTAESTAILFAPALCWLTIVAWQSLQLPQQEGSAAGQRIRKILTTSLWISLALLAVTAIFDGDALLRSVTLFLYFPAASIWLASHSERGRSFRRLASTWLVFLPLIFEYKLMSWWLRFASLDATQGSYFAHLHEKYAPRVLRLLVKQGGIFVKIGQMLSLLPTGVLPEPYLREFKTLQSRVPPRPGPEVKALISEALGQPIESVFTRFDEVPIGSASIGQVHRATLAVSGLEVVVKVQYPEVSQTIEADFANCERIVWLLDKSKMDEVRDAKTHHQEELDFQKEASNLLRVRVGLCKRFPEVEVPEPILEFCRPTVLVMTHLAGHSLLDAIMDMAEAIAKMRGKSVEDLIAEFTPSSGKDKANEQDEGTEDLVLKQDSGKLTPKSEKTASKKKRWPRGWGAVSSFMPSLPSIPDTAKIKLLQLCMSTSRSARNFGVALYNSSAGRFGANKLEYSRSLCCFDPKEMSHKLWSIHGHQVLVDGLFSTDPHPGNILVSPGGQVGLIDFGQVYEMKLQHRVFFAHLLLALAADDDEEIAYWYQQLGMTSRHRSVELLALNAKVKFGHASILSKETYERYRKLAAQDSLSNEKNSCIGRVERLVQILRGTSFLLGVPNAHGPTTLWVEMARKLLGERMPVDMAEA